MFDFVGFWNHTIANLIFVTGGGDFCASRWKEFWIQVYFALSVLIYTIRRFGKLRCFSWSFFTINSRGLKSKFSRHCAGVRNVTNTRYCRVGRSGGECFNRQRRGVNNNEREQWRYNVSIDARSKQGIAFGSSRLPWEDTCYCTNPTIFVLLWQFLRMPRPDYYENVCTGLFVICLE